MSCKDISENWYIVMPLIRYPPVSWMICMPMKRRNRWWETEVAGIPREALACLKSDSNRNCQVGMFLPERYQYMDGRSVSVVT